MPLNVPGIQKKRQMKKKPENIDPRKSLFVINTLNNNYTLHINDGRCHHVKGLTKWETFETEQSIIRFAKNNFRRCRICFPDEKEDNE